MSRRTTGRRHGQVAAFDEAAGYGEVVDGDDAERRYFFHCTAIADGSRSIPLGAIVEFGLRPGHLGRVEAWDLRAR